MNKPPNNNPMGKTPNSSSTPGDIPMQMSGPVRKLSKSPQRNNRTATKQRGDNPKYKHQSTAMSPIKRDVLLTRMAISYAMFPVLMAIIAWVPNPLKIICLIAIWGVSIFLCMKLLSITNAKEVLDSNSRIGIRTVRSRKQQLSLGLTIGAPFVVMFSWFSVSFVELIAAQPWGQINPGKRLNLFKLGAVIHLGLLLPIIFYFRNTFS